MFIWPIQVPVYAFSQYTPVHVDHHLRVLYLVYALLSIVVHFHSSTPFLLLLENFTCYPERRNVLHNMANVLQK